MCASLKHLKPQTTSDTSIKTEPQLILMQKESLRYTTDYFQLSIPLNTRGFNFHLIFTPREIT